LRLTGSRKKGIRFLPIVNFTDAQIQNEDVCVICLDDFNVADCPKFRIDLDDEHTSPAVHTAHNSQWHQECILQWIEVNSKKDNGIFCPLCQQKLKDPRATSLELDKLFMPDRAITRNHRRYRIIALLQDFRYRIISWLKDSPLPMLILLVLLVYVMLL